MVRYCDECQLPVTECPKNCVGHMEREYMKEMAKWEASPDYVEGTIY